MIHRIPLSGYKCVIDSPVFGTEGSYGNEFLMFEPDAEWSKLAIIVYFIRNNIAKRVILGANRVVAVPYEVTQTQTTVWDQGRIVVEGFDSTSKRYTVDLDFIVAPHTGTESAESPDDPTPSQYEQIVENIHSILEDASYLSKYTESLYTTDANSDANISDFVGVANTYYENRNALTYSTQKTAIDKDFDATANRIDDVTFIQLVMMGIPYNASPYTGETLMNGNYTWCFSPISYGIRNVDDLAKWMVLSGHALQYSIDYNEVRPGDIVFYATKNSSDEWVNDSGFMHISHVSMVRAIRSLDGYHTMLEAESESASVITNRVLETYNSDKVVLICRPSLSSSANIRNFSGAAKMLNYKVEENKMQFSDAIDRYHDLSDEISSIAEYQEGMRDDITDLTNSYIGISTAIENHEHAINNRIKRFYTSNLGAMSISDADYGEIRSLSLMVNSTQAATPSPSSPQPVHPVSQITITVSGGGETKQRTFIPPFLMYGIGDVYDTLDVEAGVWRQKIVRVTYDGTEQWTITGTNKYATNTGKIIAAPTMSGTTGRMSNIGVNSITSNNSLLGMNVETNKLVTNIRIPDISSMSVVMFKSWLMANPVEFVYVSDSYERTYNIDPDDLKWLRSMKSYSGNTTITIKDQNGNDISSAFLYPCSISAFVEYVKQQIGDSREFVYNVKDVADEASYINAYAMFNSQYAASIAEKTLIGD